MKKANLSNALRRLHHDELPNEFWDWLSDFDVRAKAPEVAAEQHAFIVELIKQLDPDLHRPLSHATKAIATSRSCSGGRPVSASSW